MGAAAAGDLWQIIWQGLDIDAYPFWPRQGVIHELFQPARQVSARVETNLKASRVGFGYRLRQPGRGKWLAAGKDYAVEKPTALG
ncbi:hypothetical protein JCM12107_07920 [Corynebacterium simulans]